jgi:hypothetical protein
MFREVLPKTLKHIVEKLVLQNAEIPSILQRTSPTHLPPVNRAEATDEGVHDSLIISLSISSVGKTYLPPTARLRSRNQKAAKESSSVIHNASTSSDELLNIAIHFVDCTALPFSILFPSF